MPSPMTFTIKVKLDTTKNPPVTARPGKQPIPPGRHTVVWKLTGSSGGKITRINFTDGSPFEVAPTEANGWTGTDNNANTTGSAQEFAYTITVKQGGQKYSSDPEIENQSGGTSGGGFRRGRHVMVHESA